MNVPRRWLIVWATILLVSSRLDPALASSSVSGSATSRDPMALPPGARFEATLEDASRRNEPAEVVARARVDKIGAPPIRFTIAYDKKKIVSSHRYVVRATIRDRDRLLFASESSEPVLTQGHGSKVSLVLAMAPREAHGPASLDPLPASFAGTLPCADCAGIQYLIDVLEDGAYMQRMTYMRDGRDESFYEIGAWSLSSDRRTLVLNGGETSSYWSLGSSNTLRKLDREGREIVSKLPYELTRTSAMQPLEPRVRLRGLFQYVADAARFSDCLSGLQWPVSHDGDYGDLERAYEAQKKNKKAGADLLVSLDARIALLPAMDGGDMESTLLVERFIEALPSEICLERAAQLELSNNRWRPTVLAGKPVVVSGQQHEPWIVLDAKSSKISGLTGCNRVSGSYRAGSDGRLKFSNLAATRMACSHGDVEQAFLKALERTTTYRIVGRNLELFGTDGAMVARLEERNL